MKQNEYRRAQIPKIGLEQAAGSKLQDQEPPRFPDELDIYLMTDQPPTCPRDGRRVDILFEYPATKTTALQQRVRCPECKYTYLLEDDERENI